MGALSIALILTSIACAIGAVAATAQSPPKTVAIHHVDPHDVLFVLTGDGENALALAQDDGVVLIDPLPMGWGQATLKAIDSVSDQPVKTIVNIRDSEDHL